jgi:threonine dehydratase
MTPSQIRADQKMKSRMESLTTDRLEDMVVRLQANYTDDAITVTDYALRELAKRMPAEQYSELCASL